ncbi:hypothetical protein O181_031375 [Austropuccinia psidii MF-1]|uniref:Uncharacterized protein n=1 Tax=Austropuccinia psidii MF-1 TaxID=1389203 RepID=A0A9Q3CYX9_9BASI|nr:hypothetical protein [Austropuccinia psidii MF-1]
MLITSSKLKTQLLAAIPYGKAVKFWARNTAGHLGFSLVIYGFNSSGRLRHAIPSTAAYHSRRAVTRSVNLWQTQVKCAVISSTQLCSLTEASDYLAEMDFWTSLITRRNSTSLAWRTRAPVANHPSGPLGTKPNQRQPPENPGASHQLKLEDSHLDAAKQAAGEQSLKEVSLALAINLAFTYPPNSNKLYFTQNKNHLFNPQPFSTLKPMQVFTPDPTCLQEQLEVLSLMCFSLAADYSHFLIFLAFFPLVSNL